MLSEEKGRMDRTPRQFGTPVQHSPTNKTDAGGSSCMGGGSRVGGIVDFASGPLVAGSHEEDEATKHQEDANLEDNDPIGRF